MIYKCNVPLYIHRVTYIGVLLDVFLKGFTLCPPCRHLRLHHRMKKWKHQQITRSGCFSSFVHQVNHEPTSFEKYGKTCQSFHTFEQPFCMISLESKFRMLAQMHTGRSQIYIHQSACGELFLKAASMTRWFLKDTTIYIYIYIQP